jgi:hypothetical protein
LQMGLRERTVAVLQAISQFCSRFELRDRETSGRRSPCCPESYAFLGFTRAVPIATSSSR